MPYSWGVFPGKTIFSQVVELIHPQQFRRCVARYRGNYKVKSFSCWDQFLCMAFAQLTFRESLRDIEDCLSARSDQLYHLGFRSRICRSTLADANEARDWRIYADLAALLIKRARRLYSGEPIDVELQQSVYALDSTTIDLCLNLFPWARFRSTKAAIKLHTLLDLRGPIPSFIEITDGRCHDLNALDVLVVEPGSFYVMDRGYLDFSRLYTFIKLAPTLSSVPAEIYASYAMFPNRSIPTPVFAAITLEDFKGSTRARTSQTNCAWCVSTTLSRIVASVS